MTIHTSLVPLKGGIGGEEQYLNLLREALTIGEERLDRTGVGTLGLFGRQIRFDLASGFPLLTTKKVHFRSIVNELVWFLSGNTNARELKKAGCSIWDEWGDPETGDLGPVYGKQWRSWLASDGREIDQISCVVDSIIKDPFSRRHIVTAWNPGDIGKMALPPCHCLFQFHVSNGKLSCQLYQRSADIFLGVPFNIASYALLTNLIARKTGLGVGDFVHTFGDLHLYLNHREHAEAQLAREPRPFPEIALPDEFNLFALDGKLIRLKNYDPHPSLPAPVAI